jgi:hypothetical protein
LFWRLIAFEVLFTDMTVTTGETTDGHGNVLVSLCLC